MSAAQPDLLDAITEAEAERDRAYSRMDAADVADENAVILDAIVEGRQMPLGWRR